MHNRVVALILFGLVAMVTGACASQEAARKDPPATPDKAAHAEAPVQGAESAARATPPADRAERIARVLNELHADASRSDFDAYFALFAPNAVFLGTDAGERWTLPEFKAYTRPYFEAGKGWTYTVRDRHIAFSKDGRVAWFDEALDNEKYGQCRGSGVLVRTKDGAWRVAQYNLTKTIPNERMEAVVEAIGDSEKE